MVYNEKVEGRIANVAGGGGEDVGEEQTGDVRFRLFVNSAW